MYRWQIHKKTSILSFFLLIFSGFFSFPVQAEWIEVTGEAPLGDNEVSARDSALGEAMKQAVEMVAATIIEEVSDTERLSSFLEAVKKPDAGYVRRYQIMRISCEEGFCLVSIRAEVAKDKLIRQISEITSAHGKSDLEITLDSPKRIRLDVQGNLGFTELMEIRTLLQKSPGISEVSTRSMGRNRVILIIHSLIETEILAAQLATRPLGKYSVNVLKMELDEITLEISSGSRSAN